MIGEEGRGGEYRAGPRSAAKWFLTPFSSTSCYLPLGKIRCANQKTYVPYQIVGNHDTTANVHVTFSNPRASQARLTKSTVSTECGRIAHRNRRLGVK